MLSCTHLSNAFPSRLPEGIVAENVADGLGVITDFAFLAAEKMIVSDRKGRLLLVDKGQIQWEPIFADFKSRVGASFADRGLTSVTVHPDDVNQVYVSYQYDPEPLRDRTGPKMNRVSRFLVNPDGKSLNMDSEVILLGKCEKNTTWYGSDCIPCTGESHTLGQVQFGPDKQLYVSVGEGYTFEGHLWWGRGYYDVPRNWLGPMDKNFLGGKILRLHPGTGQGLSDNPWFDGNADSARSKIWTLGLRNPWRASFVPKAPNQAPSLLVGQVGWASFEAITVAKSGVNGGWPCFEGIVETPSAILVKGKEPPAGVTSVDNAKTQACLDFYAGRYPDVPPFSPATNALTLDHSGKSAAIIMGSFLSGFGNDQYPERYQETFLFADYVSSKAYSVKWDVQGDKPVGTPVLFGATLDEPVSFKYNPYNGFTYYAAMCKRCSKMGAIRRFVPGVNAGDQGDVSADNLVTGDVSKLYNPPVPQRVGPKPTKPATCNAPGDLPVLPALPNGWDTVMYLGQFPGMQARNAKPEVGPVEVDASLGGPLAEDGQQQTIAGVRYQKGVGVGASVIGVNLQKRCYRFTADVGMDDEQRGSTARAVVEQGNQMVFDSDRSGGIESGKRGLSIDLKGLQNTEQVLFKVLEMQGATHVNWADAKFYCGPDAPFLPEVVIDNPTIDAGMIALGSVVNFGARAWDYTGWPLDASRFTW